MVISEISIGPARRSHSPFFMHPDRDHEEQQ